MPPIEDRLRRAAEDWLRDDPDPESRAELLALLERGDAAGLEDRLRGPLRFGTAGLRGLMGAGPNRMNRKVVMRATAGLAAWLAARVPDARARGVVVGFDGRHGSRRFADDVVAVLTGHGFRVLAFEAPVPTPEVAFALLHHRAAAAVAVTASHNPPAYNGYKVYWENGAQIIPPEDAGIAAAIDAVPSIDALPRRDRASAREAGLLLTLGEDEARAYVEAISAFALHPEAPRDLVIAYTALHGVGEALFRRVMARAGFTRVVSVAEQAVPDGDFPTVAFPNPEEPGAMDRVLDLAARERADLVLANDPDADRLAVAVRHEGRYVNLDGNQIGCLLGHYLLAETPPDPRRLLVSSVVSSPMLGAIARAHGARWEPTLTGHKWIQNRALALEAEGFRFVFGYEEALGYGVGTAVRDKDGISAALVIADMAAYHRARGETLVDALRGVERRYGLYVGKQVAVTLPGTEGEARMAAAMAAVRDHVPSAVGGLAVTAVEDLERGTRASAGTVSPASLPESDLLILELEGGHRAMLRPSGTEPKLKVYVDVRADGASGDLAGARASGEALADAIARELLRAAGLERTA